MSATRTQYLVVVAVLFMATLTVAVALLLHLPWDHAARGADVAICETGDQPQGCYPPQA